MSATLRWAPADGGDSLPERLRHVLEKSSWFRGDAVIGESHIAYFRGLEDAGIDGAAEMIELIEKHGMVRLWLTY